MHTNQGTACKYLTVFQETKFGTSVEVETKQKKKKY